MQILKLIAALSMATAMEYVFEQGSSGTVQCIPPSDKADVTMTQFKQDLTILWVAVANGAASSVSPNRFTASYSYSDNKELSNKYATAQLDLSLTNITLDDEATYSCQNQMSEDTQINIVVTVQPSVEVQNEQTLDTQAGQLLKIGSCTANNGKPRPTILWEDNSGNPYTGVEIVTDGSNDKLFSVTSELSLTSIQRSHHEKQFSCVVKQSGVEVNRVTINPTVNVQWKPEQTTINAADEYLEATAVSITCESNANPAPSFIWSVRDENKTLEADFQHWTISDDKMTLSTDSVQFSDHETVFLCKAQNELGEEEDTQQLIVTDEIRNGAAKGAMVYSIIGVIVVIVIVAAFILLRRVLVTKKAVYKTDDGKDEAQESLKDEELEAGKKKEYFM